MTGTLCNMCGRVLTDAASVALGVGPECAKAYVAQVAIAAAQAMAVADVKRAVAAGQYSHPQLDRQIQLLGVAERFEATDASARKDAQLYRELIANWKVKIELDGIQIAGTLTLPSFDPADRADDGDAARPTLTPAEQADANEFDATWRAMAAQDEPLDGCEEKTETPRASLPGWWNAAVAA